MTKPSSGVRATAILAAVFLFWITGAIPQIVSSAIGQNTELWTIYRIFGAIMTAWLVLAILTISEWLSGKFGQ